MAEIRTGNFQIGFAVSRFHHLHPSARDSPGEDLLIGHGFVFFGGEKVGFRGISPNFIGLNVRDVGEVLLLRESSSFSVSPMDGGVFPVPQNPICGHLEFGVLLPDTVEDEVRS